MADAWPRGRLVFAGGCFAAVASCCSYAFFGWMLCHHGFVYLVGDLCVDYFCRKLSCRSWVLRAVALFSFFFCSYVYSMSLTTSLVVCNMCYEGSLVAASCNSLCLMKNWLYSSVEKKICNGFSRVMLGASRPSPRGRHVGGPDIEKLPFLSAPL